MANLTTTTVPDGKCECKRPKWALVLMAGRSWEECMRCGATIAVKAPTAKKPPIAGGAAEPGLPGRKGGAR